MVKRYVVEEGTEVVRTQELLVVSALVRVEVSSALWRKQRDGLLTSVLVRTLVDGFEADLDAVPGGRWRFVAVPVTNVVLTAAAGLVAVHRLRSLDAIQLASAVRARGADPRMETFACFDDRLREAAAAEGFRCVPG